MVVAWQIPTHINLCSSQNIEAAETATNLASRNEDVILLEEGHEVDPKDLKSEGVSCFYSNALQILTFFLSLLT